MNSEEILEFIKIKEQMSEMTYTQAAKEQIQNLHPFLSEIDVRAAQKETTEAKMIVEKIGLPPLTSLDGMWEAIQIAGKGDCLSAAQLENVAMELAAVRRLKDFLNRAKQLSISLPYYEENLNSLDDVSEEINRVIRNGKVDDYATKTLKTLRSDIERMESKMREKADSVLRANKNYTSDSFCTVRNGRICIPIKKEYKAKIAGSVIDKSSTGSTLFMEPASVAKYADELSMLKFDEENEERRILYTLTAMLSDTEDIFLQNKRTVEKLDFAFVKARMSIEYDGTEPVIVQERKIAIRNGRHPLMDKNINVPLNFEMGEGINGVIITGPNTGGKTVAIKTVGINCLMAQCGLHVSCERAELCMHNQILCDIGDGQNIAENLSTFSAHITNALQILRKVTRESLVIMDELGSGTDPTEGMGIAIAILEELKKSGAFYLVTTHYPEVKNYAMETEGVINARMAFDRESLKPFYRLEIGEAGESCAFYIAKKLGMPGSMLKTACDAAYGEKTGNKSQKEQITIEFPIDETEELKKETAAHLKKKEHTPELQTEAAKFKRGDSVMVLPEGKTGIVYQETDEKGELGVQLQGTKIQVNYKRLKLQVSATELYPPDYDFSIIFDSVETRKARHLMSRKYAPDVTLHLDNEA